MKNTLLLKILVAIIMMLIIVIGGILIYKSMIEKNNNIDVVTYVFEANKTDENDNTNLIKEIKEEEKQEADEEETEKEESKQEDENLKNTQNNSSQNEYYIRVNYGANCVTVYTKDSNGDFTVPIKAMICSTGTATPTGGVYGISDKYTWGWLIGGVYGHYSTRIVGSILFHSVPYTSYGDNGSIEYWEYDKLGTTASAGCVRLTIADAKWIFDNCARGTQVEFYSDSNPGPLGKPSARKISNEEEYLRGWDPTDPNENNPWRTYKKEEPKSEIKEEPKEENKDKVNTFVDNNTENKVVENKATENKVIENKLTQNTTTNTQNLTNQTSNNVSNNSIDNKTNNALN